MARVVSQWPEREVKYPWATWLDGHVWELEPGEDFTVEPAQMALIARRKGANQGFRVRTKVLKGKVYIQRLG